MFYSQTTQVKLWRTLTAKISTKDDWSNIQMNDKNVTFHMRPFIIDLDQKLECNLTVTIWNMLKLKYLTVGHKKMLFLLDYEK